MASKAKLIGSTERGAEERDGETREQEIRDRAYEIYLQRGEQPADELGDWLQAERELTE